MSVGPNSLYIEESIGNSEPQRGYRADLVLPSPISAFRLPGGAVLPATGVGVVGYGVMETGADGIVWNATADNTDIIRLCAALPAEFYESALDEATGAPPVELIAETLCRVHDTTGSAAANADLALEATLAWFDDADTALNTLAAAVSNVLNAEHIGVTGFAWYTFNLSAGMTAAQRNSLAGSSFIQLDLNPNEAIGTALALDLAAFRWRIRRHAALRARTDRGAI